MTVPDRLSLPEHGVTQQIAPLCSCSSCLPDFLCLLQCLKPAVSIRKMTQMMLVQSSSARSLDFSSCLLLTFSHLSLSRLRAGTRQGHIPLPGLSLASLPLMSECSLPSPDVCLLNSILLAFPSGLEHAQGAADSEQWPGCGTTLRGA